eukprot:scaffold9821_cov61-Phaeocystis_antarctica.AAC.1
MTREGSMPAAGRALSVAPARVQLTPCSRTICGVPNLWGVRTTTGPGTGVNTQLPAHLKAGKSKAGEQIEAVWRVRRARGAAAAAHDIVRDHLGGGAAERPPHRAVPRVDVDRAGRGMAAANQRQEVGRHRSQSRP